MANVRIYLADFRTPPAAHDRNRSISDQPMPAFSLSIRRYATNEAGCWASFTFSGGWAEIAEKSKPNWRGPSASAAKRSIKRSARRARMKPESEQSRRSRRRATEIIGRHRGNALRTALQARERRGGRAGSRTGRSGAATATRHGSPTGARSRASAIPIRWNPTLSIPLLSVESKPDHPHHFSARSNCWPGRRRFLRARGRGVAGVFRPLRREPGGF